MEMNDGKRRSSKRVWETPNLGVKEMKRKLVHQLVDAVQEHQEDWLDLRRLGTGSLHAVGPTRSADWMWEDVGE